MSNESPAVFQGTIGAVRTIPSRGVVSVTVECKIEDHSLVAAVALHGVWVAVARLKEQPIKLEVTTNPESKRAGMLCSTKTFHQFLREKYEVDKDDMINASAEFVRDYCGVNSRAELTSDNQNWKSLQAEYELWLRT